MDDARFAGLRGRSCAREKDTESVAIGDHVPHYQTPVVRAEARDPVYPFLSRVTFRAIVAVHNKIRREEITFSPPIGAGDHLVKPTFEIGNYFQGLMRHGHASLNITHDRDFQPSSFDERHDIAQRAASNRPKIA